MADASVGVKNPKVIPTMITTGVTRPGAAEARARRKWAKSAFSYLGYRYFTAYT